MLDAADRLEELQRQVEIERAELKLAISERTPHDYGILKEEAQEMRKERDEACAEVERLEKEYKIAHFDRQHYKRITQDRDEKLDALHARPEPSRLEIAAWLKAGWFANPAFDFNSTDQKWWIEQADKLIAAAKEEGK